MACEQGEIADKTGQGRESRWTRSAKVNLLAPILVFASDQCGATAIGL